MTSALTSPDQATSILFQLEKRRCTAMVAGDRERLQQLLHPGLIHVHAKGYADSFESYLAPDGAKVKYTNVERFDDLQVRILGDSALMTGRQLLEGVRISSGELVSIQSQVMQVWVLEAGRWRQIAFQSTPFPD